MGGRFNIDGLSKWAAIGITALGMVALTSVSIGENRNQIENNKAGIDRIEIENKSDHQIMLEDINQLTHNE